ncbi:hypothetical protein ROZALSC1DRAFT_31690, partial [Rozella allomycis CSF55]
RFPSQGPTPMMRNPSYDSRFSEAMHEDDMMFDYNQQQFQHTPNTVYGFFPAQSMPVNVNPGLKLQTSQPVITPQQHAYSFAQQIQSPMAYSPRVNSPMPMSSSVPVGRWLMSKGETHVERRRRDYINEGFFQLQKSLPSFLFEEKMNRGSILHRSLEHIKFLQQVIEQQTAEIRKHSPEYNPPSFLNTRKESQANNSAINVDQSETATQANEKSQPSRLESPLEEEEDFLILPGGENMFEI